MYHIFNNHNFDYQTLHSRHYCSSCGGKFYTKYLQLIFYPLLKKQAWHCIKCLSANSDNFYTKINFKKPYLIELFAGSKSVSTVAEGLGYKTFTIDIEEKYQPDLSADILNLKLNHIPGFEDTFVIWASLPCTYFSILNIKNHWEKITYANRQYFYIPKTNQARTAIKLLEKTLYLIRKINPVYFFIENPRGALRHMPQVKSIPFLHTISYKDYGMEYYKPTDIFTNCNFLELKQITTAVGKQFEQKITHLNTAYQRSIVPAQLAHSILSQLLSHHQSDSYRIN